MNKEPEQPEPTEQEPIPLADWLHNIGLMHGTPSYILLRLDTNGVVSLVAVSSNSIHPMSLVLDAREKDLHKPDYLG